MLKLGNCFYLAKASCANSVSDPAVFEKLINDYSYSDLSKTLSQFGTFVIL